MLRCTQTLLFFNLIVLAFWLAETSASFLYLDLYVAERARTFWRGLL